MSPREIGVLAAPPSHRAGFALLIAVLVSGIILAIGIAILNITLKEFQLSNIARESEIAFYAADAGLECALYWDGVEHNAFRDGGTVPIECMGRSFTPPSKGVFPDDFPPSPGNPFVWEEWSESNGLQWNLENAGGQQLCVRVTVEKLNCIDRFEDEPSAQDFTCTTIVSRGYNRDCSSLDDARTVERTLEAHY